MGAAQLARFLFAALFWINGWIIFIFRFTSLVVLVGIENGMNIDERILRFGERIGEWIGREILTFVAFLVNINRVAVLIDGIALLVYVLMIFIIVINRTVFRLLFYVVFVIREVWIVLGRFFIVFIFALIILRANILIRLFPFFLFLVFGGFVGLV